MRMLHQEKDPSVLLTEKQKTYQAEIAAPLEPPELSEHTCAHPRRFGRSAPPINTAEKTGDIRRKPVISAAIYGLCSLKDLV